MIFHKELTMLNTTFPSFNTEREKALWQTGDCV